MKTQLLFLFCAMLAVAGRAAETVVNAPADSAAASKMLARYEKVLAAARAGIKQVLLPEHNRKDWAEVPEEVRAKMEVHFLRRISELLPLALVEAPTAKPTKGKSK